MDEHNHYRWATPRKITCMGCGKTILWDEGEPVVMRPRCKILCPECVQARTKICIK